MIEEWKAPESKQVMRSWCKPEEIASELLFVERDRRLEPSADKLGEGINLSATKLAKRGQGKLAILATVAV